MIALLILAGLLVGLVAFVLWDRRAERRQFLATIDQLCVRIQAPQRAAIEAVNEVAAPSKVAVNPEGSDEEFWESREALANRLMAEEVNG